MASVLFRSAPPAVDALIDQRRRDGTDRFDEVWEGVYVVNPPPSFRHSTVAGLVVDLLRPLAEPRGLVVRREVGIGGHDDHRIPDVVVARVADLDDQEHYLLTATLVVEVLSPHERVDKRPFYRSRNVDEVVLVDPLSATITWFAVDPATGEYDTVAASAALPIGPHELAAVLAT